MQIVHTRNECKVEYYVAGCIFKTTSWYSVSLCETTNKNKPKGIFSLPENFGAYEKILVVRHPLLPLIVTS